MANQIKKKFIGQGQVGSEQILIEKDLALKGTLQNGSEVEVLKLGLNDEVLVKGQEVATKAMVDTEKGRIDAILLAADADKDSFAEIVSLINSVDTQNDQAFASYVLSNDAAVALKADKTYVDSQDAATLQDAKDYTDAQIAAIPPVDISGKADITYVDAQDALKVSKDGDTMTGALIVLQETPDGFVQSILSSGGLQVTDNTDGSGLEAVVGSNAHISILTSGGLPAMPSADEHVTVKKYVNDQDAATLTSAEGYADAAVLVEKNRAEAAELALDGRLDVLEPKVAALEALEHKKFKKTLVAGDITAGYIDLPELAIAGSTIAFVDRLALHEGAMEDYSVSVVSGVTRITFLNDLVGPGSQKLAAGDNIFVKYVK